MKKRKPPFLLVSLLLVLVGVAVVMGNKMFTLSSGTAEELIGDAPPPEDKGKPNLPRPVTPETMSQQAVKSAQGVRPVQGMAPGEELPKPEMGTAIIERKKQEVPKANDSIVRSLRG